MGATERLPVTGTAWARPADYSAACSLLVEADGAGRVVAGCTALPPFILESDPGIRLAVDLMDVANGGHIDSTGSGLRIGATASIATLTEDRELAARVPLLAAAARGIGDEVVRGMATVGGNVAARESAAFELPVALAALDAELQVVTPEGERSMPGAGERGLGPLDVLAAVTVPADPGARWAYRKLTTNVRSYGVASLAVNVPSTGPPRAYASLGTATPQRLEAAEVALSSAEPFDPAGVAAEACRRLEAQSDALATGAYRLRVLESVLGDELGRMTGGGRGVPV